MGIVHLFNLIFNFSNINTSSNKIVGGIEPDTILVSILTTFHPVCPVKHFSFLNINQPSLFSASWKTMKEVFGVFFTLLAQTECFESYSLNSVLLQTLPLQSNHLCVLSDHYSGNVPTVITEEIFTPRTIITLHIFKNIETERKCSQIVMAISKPDSLNHILECMFRGPHWNRQAWYIIVATDDKLLDSFAELVLQYGIVNSVLLLQSYDADALGFGFDYFTESLVELSDSRDVLNYLEKQKMLNTHGFPLKVIVIPHYVYLPYYVTGSFGVFGKLVDTFANNINASNVWLFSLPPMDFHTMYSSNNLNLFPFLKMNGSSNEFDYVPMPTFDGLCLFIPEVSIGPIIKHLAMPFSSGVWIIILLTITIISLLNHVLKRKMPRDLLAAYFFGLTVEDHRLKRLERLILISLTWLLFLSGEAYLAKLICFVTNNKHETHIQNFDDFVNSNYQFCNSENMLVSQLFDIYPKFISKVSSLDENCVQILTCSETMMIFRVNAGIIEAYTLSERLSWWFSASTFSAKQPFAARFRTVSNRLVEAGIWKLWTDSDTLEREERVSTRLNILTFEDLISLWLLLGCGFLLAIVEFLAETGMHKFKLVWKFRR